MKPLLAACLVAISAVCVADPCGTPVLDWPAGPINVAFTDGDRFFFGAGLALVTAEQDQNGELTTLGHIRPTAWPANDVFVAGNYALVGADRSVGVLDIGSQDFPVEVGTVAVSSKVSRIRADTNVAVSHWLAGSPGGTQGIEIIDYSDPTNPVVVSSIELGFGLTSIEMIPGWLFVLTTRLLSVYDLSDPANPVLSAEAEGGSWVYLLTAHEDTLVIVTHTGVVLLDVTVPTMPEAVAYYQTHDWPEKALWTEDTLLVASDSFFEVVDVGSSTPTQLALFKYIFTNGFYSMTAAGGSCLVVDGDYDYHDLRLIDLSDPSSPQVGSLIHRPAEVRDISWSPGRIGAVTDRALWLLDLDTPGSQSAERVAQFQDKPSHVDLKDGLAFVGMEGNYVDTFDYRLQVLDVSDPSRAQVISEIDLESDQETGPWFSVQVLGNDWIGVALSKDDKRRLEVVDVSDPGNPVRGVSLPLDLPSTRACVENDLLFLPMIDNLVVIDVSAPTQPRRLSRLDIGSFVRGLGAWGRYAFPLTNDSLFSVDAGQATQPALVGDAIYSSRISYPAATAEVGRVFVFNGDPLDLQGGANLSVFDVTDPESPYPVAVVEDFLCQTSDIWNWIGLDSSSTGDLVTLGGGSCGVQGLDMSVCVQPPAAPSASFTASPPLPVSGQLVRFTDYTAGTPEAWTWIFGDGKISHDPEPQHAYVEPGTYTVELKTSNLHGSSTSSLTLEIADAAAPPVANFRWIGDAPSVLKPVQFVDESLGSPETWRWDFGDGFTSTQPHPFHLYSLPGQYKVTLKVTSSTGTDITTTVVDIAPHRYSFLGHPDEVEDLVPAVASTGGFHGTRWRTDLVLHNPTDEGDFVRVYFLERDRPDNQQSPGTLVNLHPGQTVVVEDVVGSLFSLEDTAGALWIENTWQNLLTTRTYTSGQHDGTYGQGIASIYRNRGFCEPTTQVLLGLQQAEGFRTNVGLLNSAGWDAYPSLRIFSSDGEYVGEITTQLGPFGVHQINNVLNKVDEGSIDNGYAVLDTCHWIKAYASVIDNHTGDAVYIPAQIVQPEPEAGTHLWVVPAVASIQGASGTYWKSSLEFFNPEDSTATVTLTLLESGCPPPPPQQRVLTVEAGLALRVDDVVEGLFELKTTGAVLLESSAALHLTSRSFTFNPQVGNLGGTFGQHVPAIPSSELLTEGRPSRLLNLREDVSYRSNVGFVNPSPEPASVEIEGLSPTGTPLFTTTVSLDPWEHRQINRFLSHVGEVEQATLALTVRQGVVAAYASVVDNTTGDPVFLNALAHR